MVGRKDLGILEKLIKKKKEKHRKKKSVLKTIGKFLEETVRCNRDSFWDTEVSPYRY